MSLVSDRCICLRKIEYSETSQILSLFSCGHGIVRVLAKGAHRRTKAGASKFDGGIDLLDLGDAVFTDNPARELATLTEWKLQDGNSVLRRNLRGLWLGLYAAELTGSLLEEHDPHPTIFDSLQSLLGDLVTPRLEEAFVAFELHLLNRAGFLPQFGQCAKCGAALGESRASQAIPPGFSASAGGAVCANCRTAMPDTIPMDIRLLRLLENMSRWEAEGSDATRLPRLTRHQTDPINRVLAAHVRHITGRRLHLIGYVAGHSYPAKAAGHPRGDMKGEPLSEFGRSDS